MILEGLTALVAPWASFYSDHAIVRTGVTFVHVGGLLTSGGLALASDRAVLRATEADRPLRLADLGTTHRTVVVGLGLVILSGVLLFLADLETYLTSWVFWTKMGLVVLLLVNGLLLLRSEQALEQNLDLEGGWSHLRRRAIASVSLWLLITLIGTALVNLS
jgi:uncharacterized membrane protein